MRYPTVAGAFYEGDAEALEKQIENCFRHHLGPGAVPPVSQGARAIKGLIVPHAGFVYSGPIAAHAYAALARDGFPDTFVILGPNHRGAGSLVATTDQDFGTPLGKVLIDKPLMKEIFTGIIDNDITAHRFEHSIEVQLPFLQYLKRDIKFVPVCLMEQDIKTAKEVGEIIGKACKGRDAVVIASSDFTHFGRAYGYAPVRGTAEQVMKWIKDNDLKAAEKIMKLDVKGFYKKKEGDRMTICGSGPIMAMLTATKHMGGKGAELLKYATSYDVSHDIDMVVGYAAIAVK